MYLLPSVTSSCKMARTKQARIPGYGSGEAGPNLTSLALERPGQCSSHIRGQGTYAGAPRARASGRNKTTNTPLHGGCSLGLGGTCDSKRECAQRTYGDTWKGAWGGGAVVTLKQSGWLSVCPSSVSKQVFPVPFSSLPFYPHYFPWASIILFFLIYSHCSRQTKEKEQWWSLGC